MITSKPEDHKWETATLDDPRLVESCLLTLITGGSDGVPAVVGNAFIIYASGSSALCLTAAHNFEYVKALEKSGSVQSHPTLPPDFRAKGTQYIKGESCVAMWTHDGQSHVCKISHINYIENYDLAVFSARAPDDASAFPGAMSLDLRMPAVGTKIGVVAHKLDSKPKGDGSVVLTRGFIFLLGTVSEGAAIDRKKQMFSFETTIPILPGISGAPIVSVPTPGQPVTVCGVVSSDFSPEEAFKDFTIAGSSHGAALWPSAGHGFEMNIEGKLQTPALIGDLLKGGYLTIRSKDVTVVVNPQGERMQIVYTDASNKDTSGIVLDTVGHPLRLT